MVIFLKGENLPEVAPHEICLKPGAPVMFLRNMNKKLGMMNGTRAVVQKCLRYTLLVQLVNGNNQGTAVFVPRINLTPPDNGPMKINFIRRQLPVRLAYAMTINKAQGQTLSRVGLWLPRRKAPAQFLTL